MSINSIDRNEMKNIQSHWAAQDENTTKSDSQKRAQARRRIEALKDIRDSGLSYEEALELGLIH